MKNVLYILAIIFSFSANAQETLIVPLMGTPSTDIDNHIIYYKDTNNVLNKYLGNWVYDNGTDYLKITFTKDLHVACCNNSMFNDEISGKFLYKKNGVTIYDTYTSDSAKYIKGSGVAQKILSNGTIEFTNDVTLTYSEPVTNRSCDRIRIAELNLLYIHNGIGTLDDQLNWVRVNNVIEGGTSECENGTLKDASEFQIPSNIILTKQ